MALLMTATLIGVKTVNSDNESAYIAPPFAAVPLINVD